MATGAPCRATATTSAIDREKPSRVTVGGMRKGSYCPALRDAKVDATRGQGMLPRPLDFHSALLTPRRLPRGYRLPTRRRPLRLDEFRVPRICLHARIEDRVLAADIGHPQRAVVQHGAVHDLEDITEARSGQQRSEEHTSELQSRPHLVCRLL